MNTFFLGLIAIAFVAFVIIFIIVMVELKGAIKGLKELIGTTERTMKPTLIELQETMKSVRNFIDNVNDVTEDIRVFSGSLKEVGEGVKSVSEQVESMNSWVGHLASSTVAEASGLRAGFKAGVLSVLRNLFKQDQK